MLNERLERIYKDGINNYIVPISSLNLEENPTIVFDIESCGLENNTKALTYSIAAMSATNDSNIFSNMKAIQSKAYDLITGTTIPVSLNLDGQELVLSFPDNFYTNFFPTE